MPLSDGTHGVLADAEVQVAPAVVVGLEAARTLERHVALGRRRQVGGTADQPGHVRADRVQHLLAAVARGQALRIGGERGDVGIPAGRQFVVRDHVQFAREVGILGPVAGEQRIPRLRLRLAARAQLLGEALAHAVGHEEGRLLRPAVERLRTLDLLRAQRLAVRLAGALLVRRAPADRAVNADEARPAGLRLRRFQRLQHRRRCPRRRPRPARASHTRRTAPSRPRRRRGRCCPRW